MTWFDNKGCLACVLSLIGCMPLSQADFTNFSIPVKAMNNYLCLYLWRKGAVWKVLEVSAPIRLKFFSPCIYLQMLTIESISLGRIY